MVKPLEALDKIGNFIEKYTGSEYNYGEPDGEITKNYDQVGEIFGFPVWVDDNKRYENEYLNFPSLADILSSVGTMGISFEVKLGECSVCLIIKFSIPLIEYPPFIICLSKPDCGKKEDKWKDLDCIPPEEYEEYLNYLKSLIDNYDFEKNSGINAPPPPTKPPCPPDDNMPDDVFIPGDSSNCYSARITINETGRPPIVGGWFGAFCGGTTVDTTQGVQPYSDRNFSTGWMDNSRHVTIFNAVYSSANFYYRVDFYGFINTFYETKSTQLTVYKWSRRWEFTPIGDAPPIKEPDSTPIPDPPPMKDCCDDLKKILARIEKRINEMHKVINPDQFKKKECTIPKNWIFPTNEQGNVTLEDIPDYLGAIARLIDTKLGATPQIVGVKDADPSVEGDQEIKIVVSSLGDLMRLTLEYLIQTQGNVGAIQMMSAATLYESGFTHQIAASTERKVQAITEFLDFEVEEKKEKLKMAFDPTVEVKDKERLLDLLPRLIRPHEQLLETYNWKGGESLKDMVQDARKKAIFAAAAVTETRSPDQVIDEQLNLQRLLRLLQVREIDERLGIKDYKDLSDEAEKGYPESNLDKPFKTKPYGFTPPDKPKFKKVTRRSKKTRYKKEKPKK